MKAETKFIVCLVLNVCIFISNLFQRSRAIFQSKIHKFKMQEFRRATEKSDFCRDNSINVFIFFHIAITSIESLKYHSTVKLSKLYSQNQLLAKQKTAHTWIIKAIN